VRQYNRLKNHCCCLSRSWKPQCWQNSETPSIRSSEQWVDFICKFLSRATSLLLVTLIQQAIKSLALFCTQNGKHQPCQHNFEALASEVQNSIRKTVLGEMINRNWKIDMIMNVFPNITPRRRPDARVSPMNLNLTVFMKIMFIFDHWVASQAAMHHEWSSGLYGGFRGKAKVVAGLVHIGTIFEYPSASVSKLQQLLDPLFGWHNF